MFVWLETGLVLAIHARQVAEHGGDAGVRDAGLLDSALARPRQLAAYGDPPPDLADLAAALAYGITRNHPFVDGNKRTAAVCCETFVELNGFTLEASDLELYEQYIALAEGKLSEHDFAAWLRERLRSDPPAAAHETGAAYRAAPRQRTRPKARSGRNPSRAGAATRARKSRSASLSRR